MSSSASWSAAARAYTASFTNAVSKVADVAADMLAAEAAVNDKPTVVLDLAAGPATATMPILQRLHHAKAPAHVFVTDIAPGMIEAAKQRIDDALAKWRADGVWTDVNVTCAVMDAEALTIAEGSVTHAACMFGIMFFPHRDLALRELRRVMVPGGRAVVGTWRSVGGLELAEAFGRSVGALGEGERSASRDIVEIGSDPTRLEAELTAAGFHVIEVRPVRCVFKLAPDDMLAALRTNPGMSPCLRNSPPDTDWDAAWRAFLAPAGGGYRWVSPDGTIVLDAVANVALMRA